MELFHRRNGPKPGEAPVPATPEQLGLFEHLDQQAAIVVRDGQTNLQGRLHVCLTQEGFEKAAAALGLAGKNSGPYQAVLGMGLDTVLRQEGYQALVLYGLAGNQMEFTLTREALEPMKDVVDSFCILYAAARGAMPQEEARRLMGAKTVFFLGELPKTGKKGETFGFATIRREGYESVRAFLTPDSARKFNREGHPVTPVRLADLVRFVEGVYAVIVEPHRNYWLELGVESVKGGR